MVHIDKGNARIGISFFCYTFNKAQSTKNKRERKKKEKRKKTWEKEKNLGRLVEREGCGVELSITLFKFLSTKARLCLILNVTIHISVWASSLPLFLRTLIDSNRSDCAPTSRTAEAHSKYNNYTRQSSEYKEWSWSLNHPMMPLQPLLGGWALPLWFPVRKAVSQRIRPLISPSLNLTRNGCCESNSHFCIKSRWIAS